MTKQQILNDEKIEQIDFGVALSDRYFSYALSTIMSRSLPSVCDGLKPVHRRLLYAMYKLHLDPKSNFKKSARIVGDVIGKYHPHGDVAVYDTLVRLVQGFALRYPLVEGQGNFGSVDGDNAAAMRYTEARMTDICSLLIEDIESDTVDFCPTYDASDNEPILMPAKFPNLLANGSEGIAVGMATSVPPHNLSELSDAIIYLIDNRENPDCKKILNLIKGPDFPTGGVIINSKDDLYNIYSTGRGSVTVRSVWNKEQLNNGTYQIVITEIPYQIQKIKLIEQIVTLFKEKKLPLISNIADESAEEIRIVIEPKSKNVDPETMMQSLFKLTSLESRITINMNVLDQDNVPRVMNIVEILDQFLGYREKLIIRKTKYQIAQIDKRLEVLAALKVAYLNLDEVIRIIREEDHPKQIMIDKFRINDNQAEAILNIKLRLLRKLEEEKINIENQNLKQRHQDLTNILTDSNQLSNVIKNELQEIKTQFGKKTDLGKRKTNFMEISAEAKILDISAFVEKEPITIICSKLGWIRSMKGHNLNLSNVKYKEMDEAKYIIELYSTEKLLICSSGGKFFTLLVSNIVSGKGYGESVKIITDIGNDDIVDIFGYIPDTEIIIATASGKGFIVETSALLASTKLGKQVMHTTDDPNSRVVICKIFKGNHLAVIGTNRKLLIFSADQLPKMRRGKGVILQKYTDKFTLSDLTSFNIEDGLSWPIGTSRTRVEKDISSWVAKRGTVGKIPPKGFPKNNRF